MKDSYLAVAQKKQAERASRIPPDWSLKSPPSQSRVNVTQVPKECGILQQKEIRITEEYDVVSLAQAIAGRELSSLEVTRAFCKV